MSNYEEYQYNGSYEPNASDFLADYDAYLYSLKQEQQLEPVVTQTKNIELKSKSFKKDSVIEDLVVEQENGLFGCIKVCKKTGEVLARYETVPVTKLSNAEYSKLYKITPTPINARSLDDLDDYCKLQRKNKSKIVKQSGLVEYATIAAGKRRYGDYSQPDIPKSVLNILKALCSAVKIHNVFIATRAEIALLLGIRQNHLLRTLATVNGYIKVFDEKDGMRRGYLKIAITPHFVFAGAGAVMHQQREQAMKDWYVRDLVAEAVGSTSYADHIDWLCKPSNRQSYEDTVKFSEDFEAYLKSFGKRKGGKFIV